MLDRSVSGLYTVPEGPPTGPALTGEPCAMLRAVFPPGCCVTRTVGLSSTRPLPLAFSWLRLSVEFPPGGWITRTTYCSSDLSTSFVKCELYSLGRSCARLIVECPPGACTIRTVV